MKRFLKRFVTGLAAVLFFLPLLASAQNIPLSYLVDDERPSAPEPKIPPSSMITIPGQMPEVSLHGWIGSWGWANEPAQPISQATLLTLESYPMPDLPQPKQEKCNSHQRKWYKPLSSNMCQEDFDKWVEPRLKDHFYKDKTFWAGLGVIGVSLFLDGDSSARRPPGFIEGNPILGQHPSTGKMVGFFTLDFGVQTALHIFAWKQSHFDPSKSWRIFGQWGVPAGVAAINARQGILNYRLEAGKP